MIMVAAIFLFVMGSAAGILFASFYISGKAAPIIAQLEHELKGAGSTGEALRLLRQLEQDINS